MPEIVFRSSLALAPAGGNRDGCGSGFWPPQLIDNSKCLGRPMGAGVPVIKLISNLQFRDLLYAMTLIKLIDHV